MLFKSLIKEFISSGWKLCERFRSRRKKIVTIETRNCGMEITKLNYRWLWSSRERESLDDWDDHHSAPASFLH